MVKGISRQVILVKSPDPALYEQAIFVLREDAKGITDPMLLKEALRAARPGKKRIPGPVWACAGAALMALVWWLTVVL